LPHNLSIRIKGVDKGGILNSWEVQRLPVERQIQPVGGPSPLVALQGYVLSQQYIYGRHAFRRAPGWGGGVWDARSPTQQVAGDQRLSQKYAVEHQKSGASSPYEIDLGNEIGQTDQQAQWHDEQP